MYCYVLCDFFFFKQKTAYDMRISDWSSDVCSSDLKEFGLFIEDNAKDVLDPAGGDLLQMALNFSSLRQVTFNSGRRLQDGTVSFEFKEEEKTGNVKLPPQIKLALPVFRDRKSTRLNSSH